MLVKTTALTRACCFWQPDWSVSNKSYSVFEKHHWSYCHAMQTLIGIWWFFVLETQCAHNCYVDLFQHMPLISTASCIFYFSYLLSICKHKALHYWPQRQKSTQTKGKQIGWAQLLTVQGMPGMLRDETASPPRYVPSSYSISIPTPQFPRFFLSHGIHFM